MKLSILSRTIGVSVICFNLAMIPLAVPVSAQTSTATGSTTKGSNTTSNDVNANYDTAPSGSTTGASNAPGEATTGNTTAVGSSNSENSTPSSGSTTGTSTATDSSTPGNSIPPSSSTTSTAPAQETTPTRGASDWGWLGLLGLLGLVSLFRKPASLSTTGVGQTTTDTSSDRLHPGVAAAGVGANTMFDDLKTNINNFKENRAHASEIKRIKDALGRPTKRVILDTQDNIILNVGDLVTHKAVDRARSADMLDVLLDSVDDKEPEIANEEYIAPAPGEASLEKRQHDASLDGHR